MDAKAWIDSYSRELGVQAPSAEEFEALLELAAVAAHASERVAAPVACWVSAQAGRSPHEALRAAQDLAPQEGG